MGGGFRPRNAVYPRVCGGSQAVVNGTTTDAGLSPRVRGKPDEIERRFGEGRSIPACAGEA